MRNPFDRGPLMAPADGDTPKGSAERGGNHRQLIEQEKRLFFRDLVLRRANKLNEGNNGLICSLDLSNANEEEIQACEELGILEPGNPEGAIKLLKIYSGGAAMREFRTQDHAWRSVQKARDAGRDDLASVPKVRVFTSIDVNPEVRDIFMKRFGFKAPTESVEAFVMDQIRGKDIATIMFQEVLLRHRDSNYRNRETVESMDFPEVAQQAYNLLGLASRFEGDVGGELNAETRRLQNMQAQKVYDFLGDSGLRIHKPLLNAMRNTIGVFHENGLIWRDGHQRNFMIAGEYDADKIAAGTKPGIPFVIDFGGSEVLGHRPLSEEAHADFEAIDKLSDVFVKGKTTRSTMESKEHSKIDAWRSKSERMAKHPSFTVKLERLAKEWKKGDIDVDKVIQSFGRAGAMADNALPAFLVLMELTGKIDETVSGLNDYLETEGKKLPLADQSDIRNFIRQMEK